MSKSTYFLNTVTLLMNDYFFYGDFSPTLKQATLTTSEMLSITAISLTLKVVCDIAVVCHHRSAHE